MKAMDVVNEAVQDRQQTSIIGNMYVHVRHKPPDVMDLMDPKTTVHLGVSQSAPNSTVKHMALGIPANG